MMTAQIVPLPGSILIPHKLASLFPLMEEDELQTLAADMRAHGLAHPIVLHEGKILDGRNRYRACVQTGINARCVEYAGDDPLGFVISSNLHRRHLSESQRAMVAAKLANMTHGGDRRRDQDANLHVDRANAAKLLNVSARSVADAAKVRKNGTDELIEACEKGVVPVSVAAKLTALPKSEQQKVVAVPKRAAHAAKQYARTERETRLATATRRASKSLSKEVYAVLYADPPWRFEPYSRDTGLDRAADNHYPTLTLDELQALKVPAANDAALFLWATNPMLPEAIALMAAWGFTYKTNFVWVKDRVGTGYWNRSRHELLLVGTRGRVPAPAYGEQYDSVIEAARERHSAKPAAAAEMIEDIFPNLARIELFARGPRLGWEVWGNEQDGRV